MGWSRKRWPGGREKVRAVDLLYHGVLYFFLLAASTSWGFSQKMAEGWQVCLPQSGLEHPYDQDPETCEWVNLSLPADLFHSFGERFQGWAIYRNDFPAPENCKDGAVACSLVLGEVGDAVEASLNGVTLGRRGNFPPEAKYARQYPARFDLPSQLWRDPTNRLRVVVYSLKLAQSGIRKGPIEIQDSVTASRSVQWLTAGNVVLPLVGGLILFVMGLVQLIAVTLRSAPDSSARAFTGYCFAASVFLISFSELPREYLPISLAGYLHFSLRVLFDASTFLLVSRFFQFRKAWLYAAYVVYGIAFFAFWASYFNQLLGGDFVGVFRGFDAGYFIMRVAFPLIIIPPLSGFIGALVRKGQPARRFLIPFFAMLTAAAVWDVAVFQNLTVGFYAVKIYPLILGVVFLWLLTERHQQRVQGLLVTQQRASQAAQVAHDIRSPLTALNLVLGDIDSLPEGHRILIRGAVNRINDIANQLLNREQPKPAPVLKEDTRSGEESEVLLLTSALESIVAEKRMQYREHRKLHIEMELDENAYGLFAKVQRGEWMRVVSNLISNAVEAMEGSVGQVTLLFTSSAREVTLHIRDNGRGIAPALLTRLTAEGGSFDKEGGMGLGLAHARRTIKAWNGKLGIHSEVGKGTEISLLLPRAAPPQWFVPQLALGPGDEVIAVDDDDTIHQVWTQRLSEWVGQKRIALKHFTSPQSFLVQRFDEKQGRGKRVFLVDFEFIGDKTDGVSLILQAGLERDAILVTSRFAEPNVRRRCEAAGIKLVPKNLAALLPIRFSS